MAHSEVGLGNRWNGGPLAYARGSVDTGDRYQSGRGATHGYYAAAQETPVNLDDGKPLAKLGSVRKTPYDEGIRKALNWMRNTPASR